MNGLKNLENLNHLDLQYNKIRKIESFNSSSKLEYLDLSYNRIRTTSGLENLVNLKKLILHNNRISIISCLENLENLELLILDFDRISEIKGLNKICCCCGCCCDILVNQKKFNSPAQYFASNFYAELDSNACVSCGICEEHCKMDAIKINDEKYHVDLTRCIGCGNCSSICPVKAITLVKKQEHVLPPKNSYETYKAIAYEKMKLNQLE